MPSCSCSASAKPGRSSAAPLSTTRATSPPPSCERWKSSELRTSPAISRMPFSSTVRTSASGACVETGAQRRVGGGATSGSGPRRGFRRRHLGVAHVPLARVLILHALWRIVGAEPPRRSPWARRDRRALGLGSSSASASARQLRRRLGRRLQGQIGRGDQLAGFDERDRAALGELARHRLDAAADDAGEAAQRPLGDRHVRQPVDVQVQHAARVLGVGAVERADQRERGEVDALRAQAGVAHRGEQPLDHVALGGDEHDALARALRRVDDPERVEVEHRVESGIGTWSWAWKRTAASSSLRS